MKHPTNSTTNRIGRLSYIRNLTGAILVGVAFTISSGQVFAAGTDPCGTGQWTFELPYEQGRPVQMETSDAGCDESIASVQATGDVVSRLCTSFHDVGGPPYVDETCADIVRAAAGEAQAWPNFDSTSIAIQSGGVATTEHVSPPSFSLTNNGRSILLTESKEAPVEFARSINHPF